MPSRIAKPRIPGLGNSPFLLFLLGASSGIDDYSGAKEAVSIARPHILKSSRVDAHHVLIVCILFFCLFLCVPKMWVNDRNYLDLCLVLRGPTIQIEKCYTLTSFRHPPAENLKFLGMQKKEGEENSKKQSCIVQKPPKNGAFYRKVVKMAKVVGDFLVENH